MVNTQRNYTLKKRMQLMVASILLLVTPFSPAKAEEGLDSLAERLRAFSVRYPQEKVYVHMDNTCYQLGDTIWFAAYTRQTDTDMPSEVSGVLYAELWNHDGYLVERKMIPVEGGRGNGFFSLNDSLLYAGYYELRAYTRWQLNWGEHEREHGPGAEDWFFNRQMAKDFYRDYDKLYSRVVPVYDRSEVPEEAYREMTLRPLRRYFRASGEASQLRLSFYPEGGQLVAGAECHVAFEAATEEGEAVGGTLFMGGTRTATCHRGRGSLVLTPEAGRTYRAKFVAADGREVVAELPCVVRDGVALHAAQHAAAWHFSFSARGTAREHPLVCAIRHEGRVELLAQIEPDDQLSLTDDQWKSLAPGVHQITVSDDKGRVYADRLFFVTKPEVMRHSLSISGIKDQYEPFEKVALTIANTRSPAAAPQPEAHLSLAVRDAERSDRTFDSGNIMTEMLLASEIKGFVPQPEWYFECDDEEHRRGLDLLMLTQGWRRFGWRDAVDSFAVRHPAEHTPILQGQVYTYHAKVRQDELQTFDSRDLTLTPWDVMQRILRCPPGPSQELAMLRDSTRHSPAQSPLYYQYYHQGWGELIESLLAEMDARESGSPAGSYRLTGDIARSRFSSHEFMPRQALKVHAEYVDDAGGVVVQDTTTTDGTFEFRVPCFTGERILFLSAGDSATWKTDKPSLSPRRSRAHYWVMPSEGKIPEFYVRLRTPYPRFVQPYSFYQTHQPSGLASVTHGGSLPATQMRPIVIGASHGGVNAFSSLSPTVVRDAYEAFNDLADAGLSTGWFIGRTPFANSLARYYAGDMNSSNTYLLQPRYDGHTTAYSFTPQQLNAYNNLAYLKDVAIYTDYSPRQPDERVAELSTGFVSIDLRRLPDEDSRYVYRDRRYAYKGLAVCEDFYHPDYQRHPPREGQKDYRRTLYWNPDLQLDADGRASVTFYNNSQKTRILVEAEGQAADGQLFY